MPETKTFSVQATISEEMVNAFAELTGDYNSLHMNEEIARKSRFRTRIVHGMLPFSLLALIKKACAKSAKLNCFSWKFSINECKQTKR